MSAGGIAAGIAAALLAACASAPRAERAVAEGPRIEVAFAGAASVDAGELRSVAAAELARVARGATARAAVDDAAFALSELYRARGFARCEVDYAIERADAEVVRARFDVREGPRTVLESLAIRGARAFPQAELMALVDPEGALPGGPFVARALDRAADQIAGWYAAHGYLDVAVGEPMVELAPDAASARATIDVVEGPRYALARAPRIEGGMAAIDARIDWSDAVGAAYTRRLAQELSGRVAEAYAREGRPDARVAVLEERVDAGGEVALAFQVEPGPRVTISDVVVRGNAKLSTARLRGWIELAPGDVYDARKERSTFRALYRTGLFSRVQVELEKGAGSERRLLVEVEEAPSVEMYLEPGYGSYEGARVLAGVRDKNLFGSGRTGEVEGLAAELADRVSTALIEPRLFDTDLSASVSLYRESRIEPSFASAKLGGALALRRELGDDAEAVLEYRLRRSEISHADLSDPLAQAALSDVDLSSVAVTGARDTRDSALAPHQGSLVQASVELADKALGSELDFVRVRFALARFFELGAATVLGASFRAGAIVPTTAGQPIPLQERFFNGGEGTVRSFREGRLGPLDSSGQPLGGEAFDVVSIELRQRLRGDLAGALFVDAGNVVDDASDWFDAPGVRYAAGLGLRYMLPIGPLRVDAGFNPDPRADEADYAVHFSIGMSF